MKPQHPPDFYMLMGLRIRGRREALRISRPNLASMMRRLGHTSIYPERQRDIEQSTRKVQAHEILDYCRLLKVPPWWLLGMDHKEAAALDVDFQERG